ncbi:MAG: cupin domain-containing protein [Polyangiaceae bacterium]|nr:cupin domain-containing protein [Polyangiaceae bacterium]
MSAVSPHVVHEGDVATTTLAHGESVHLLRKQLAAAAGGSALGCSLVALSPGKSSWPLHAHAANEEAIYVLSGEGELQLGEARVSVRAGTYAALRPGPAHAHRMHNTSSTEELRYLCISTMIPVDVLLYPRSNKLGVMAGAGPGGAKKDRWLEAFVRHEPLDYWEGEDD